MLNKFKTIALFAVFFMIVIAIGFFSNSETHVYAETTHITSNTTLEEDTTFGTSQPRKTAQKDTAGTVDLFTHDNQGRQLSHTQKKQNNTQSIATYSKYDKAGNKRFETDGNGVTKENTYDELNRVLTKTVPNIGESEYVYDIITGVDAGCIKETSTDPKDNVTAKIYDKAGRLLSVIAGGGTTTYSYYDNGSTESVTYPSGSNENYTYNDDGLLCTLTNKDADDQVMDTYSYVYDAAHNQTSKSEIINSVNKGTTTNTYDELNRLETVTEPSSRETAYTYDAAGNRLTETVTDGSTTTVNTYTYNSQNRLTGIAIEVNETPTDTTAYEYDNNGNQLSTTVNNIETVTNTYDKLNRLIETVLPGSSTTTVYYTYNGDGLRVAKSVNSVLTRYLYEYDKVVLETNGSGDQTARNVYGTNLLMREADSDTYYYIYNGHADVTALIDSDGDIAATYYYDPFGNILSQTGTVNNDVTYAGYQYDAQTGLYYCNARYYDPKIARFLSEDTYTGNFNDPLSLNLYTYCHNEPVMYNDPDGHLFREIRNAWNWLMDKIGIKPYSKPSETSTISQNNPDWADKADDIISNSATTVKVAMAGLVDKSVGAPLEDISTSVIFNDWTSDFNKTPKNWKPALTAEDVQEEHIRNLQDLTGNSPDWIPDKGTEFAYSAAWDYALHPAIKAVQVPFNALYTGIKYAGRSDNGISGVTKGIEGTFKGIIGGLANIPPESMQVEYPKDWMTASLTQALSDNNSALQKYFNNNPLVSGSINGISDALVSVVPFKLFGAADYQGYSQYETGRAVESTGETVGKLGIDALKKIGVPAENSGIRAVTGNADDAFNFFKDQVNLNMIKEVKPGTFVGKDSDGLTFTYRASSRSGPPTIDVNGVPGLRKIKYINGGAIK